MSKLLFDGLSLTVEVGFSTTAGPNTLPSSTVDLADIVWTDITAYVQEVSTTRGRSSELDTYSAGSCSVKVDNWDRRFDPEYSSGPYYGKLTPLRPIRIRATISGGTTFDIFFGYVDEWPQMFSYSWDGTVTITATDGFKILNLVKLPSVWVTSITDYSSYLQRWWRLSDPNDSFYIYDSQNKTQGSAQWMSSAGAGISSTSISSGSLLVGEPATSSSFDGKRFVQAYDPLGVYGNGGMASAWTVEMWIQTTETTTGNYAIWNHGDFIHGGAIGMVVADGNATIVGQFGHRGTSSAMTTYNVQVTVNDGQPHHIFMAYQSDPSFGTTYTMLVDGISTAVTGSYTDIVTRNYTWMTLGFPIEKSATVSNNFPNYFSGSIQEVLVWTGLFPSSYGIAHYQIGKGSYLSGQRTDERIDLILSRTEWPSDGTDLATGSSTVLGIITTDRNALEALKEMETAEQGRLFMSADGQIKFVDRAGLGAGKYVTSQGQFDDYELDDLSHGISYTNLTFSYDDRFIFNDIITQQPNGVLYEVEDASSQTQYGKRTSKIDNLMVDTGYLLANTAESRLSQYKQPTIRLETLSVDGRLEPIKQDPLLSFEIGDRITVIRTPSTGAPIQKQLIIEGIKHNFTTETWSVQFNTSPTYNAPFVLDSSVLGVLDTNVLGY